MRPAKQNSAEIRRFLLAMLWNVEPIRYDVTIEVFIDITRIHGDLGR